MVSSPNDPIQVFRGDPAELVDVDTAAEVLGVTTDRIGALVAEGLLTPRHRGDDPEPCFVRAEVTAARLAGA